MSDMSEPELKPDGAALDHPVKKKSSRRRTVIVVTAAIVVAAAGAAYIASPKVREATDNAYLRADETIVAPQVKGRVAEVLVHDNEPVKAGDPLVRISAEEFDARVVLAQAEGQNAQAAVEAAKAAIIGLDAEERLAESNTRAVETAINSANAQQVRSAIDQTRYEHLAQTGAVPVRDAEIARAAALVAQADADRSKAALSVSRNQMALTRTKRATLKAALAQAEAGLLRSQANLDLARQDQAHGLVRAPVDGVVGALQARVGDFVQPASRLMAVVPLHKMYVVAYFKETQTALMNPGQVAEVEVDASPGLVLNGTVESFAPGTGSDFSMLPFEPGTGNFTKIVQRVPVRIRFDAGQEAGLAKLRPGLSAKVTVRFAK